jgi:hypothetical protein
MSIVLPFMPWVALLISYLGAFVWIRFAFKWARQTDGREEFHVSSIGMALWLVGLIVYLYLTLPPDCKC